MLDPIRQYGQRHFQRVRFFIRQRLRRQYRITRNARLHAPVNVAFAFGGHIDLLRLAAHYIGSIHIERERYLLGRGQVVVRNHAQHRFIALAEEPRRS